MNHTVKRIVHMSTSKRYSLEIVDCEKRMSDLAFIQYTNNKDSRKRITPADST